MRRSMKRLVVAVTVASLLILPGVATGGAVRIKARGSAGSYRFDPDFPHVPKGSRVVWRNKTSVGHTLSFYKGRWKGKTFNLPAEGKFAKKARRKGTYSYRCTIPGHSSLVNGECNGMCGKLHVAN